MTDVGGETKSYCSIAFNKLAGGVRAEEEVVVAELCGSAPTGLC